MRRRLLILTFVALLPVAIVACSEPTLADWIAQADKICERAQADSDANPPPESPLPGEKLRVTAQRSSDELDALKKLDRPQGMQKNAAVGEYLLTLQHRIDVLIIYADELDKVPAQGPLPDRSQLENHTTQAYTQGVALGLEYCAGGVDFTVATTTSMAPTVESTTPVPTAIGGQPENEETTEDLPG